MFIFLGILFAGIALGYFFRRVEMLQRLGTPIVAVVCVLLFVMGFSVGANETILKNLHTLGLQALLIAFAATFGSVLAAWAVYRFIFKNRIGKNEK